MAITKGTYAAIPGSPSSGDLHFLTDSFWNAVYYNGSSWDHFLHGKLLITPPSFSWVNQGAASVSTTNGGESLICASAGGAHQVRIRKRAAPSTPYTVTLAYLPTVKGINYSFCGALFRESSTGKLRTLHLGFNANPIIEVYNWTNETTPSAQLAVIRCDILISSPLVFWRIQDDGTNRKYHFSGDGINFVQIYTEGRTVDMTADEVGWFIDPYNQDQAATLIHWKEE